MPAGEEDLLQNTSHLLGAMRLLAPWFSENARRMPWRDDPSAYHTWVSEIMLQQTRVETVIPYYLRFTEALPDTKALAACPEDRLLKLWEGLGYYSRVRNLQKAAGLVEAQYGGRIPETKEELLKLPGIGAYTAGAILSIAYGKPVPVVDGNVLRVLSRILGDPADIAKEETKKADYALLAQVIVSAQEEIPPGVFNQSLMELGAIRCVPNGEPKCASCPVSAVCRAYLSGDPRALPVKSPKKARNIRQITVLVLTDGDCVYITKNEEEGLLSRLYGFPFLEGSASAEEAASWAEQHGFSVSRVRRLGPAKHVFTHVEWHMEAFLLTVSETDGSAHAGLIPASAGELRETYALSRAFRKWEIEERELVNG